MPHKRSRRLTPRLGKKTIYGWKLTTNHEACCYGQPVIWDDNNHTYGVGAFGPDGTPAIIFVMEHLTDGPLADNFVKMAGQS